MYNNLEDIRQAVINCQKCPLHLSRKKGVAGHGNPLSKVMLVGEAPGRHEDQLGLPFVGTAGKVLTEGLLLAHWRREDLWITNLVKSRPPKNRDPWPSEVLACQDYFLAELRLIQPLLVILLGRYALRAVNSNLKIGKVHGQGFVVDKQHYFASYHPAATLYSSKLKAVFQEDLIKARRYWEEIQVQVDL